MALRRPSTTWQYLGLPEVEKRICNYRVYGFGNLERFFYFQSCYGCRLLLASSLLLTNSKYRSSELTGHLFNKALNLYIVLRSLLASSYSLSPEFSCLAYVSLNHLWSFFLIQAHVYLLATCWQMNSRLNNKVIPFPLLFILLVRMDHSSN